MWRFIRTTILGAIIFLLPAAILSILFNVFSGIYNLIKEPLDHWPHSAPSRPSAALASPP